MLILTKSFAFNIFRFLKLSYSFVNKTGIYQSMCALIEKMVNLNKFKEDWTEFGTKIS